MLMYLSNALLPWITQHGVWVLFILLTLGIIALPIPDESLLVSAGFLISKGDLQLIPTTLASILGAWCGITVSYLLGIYLGPSILKSKISKFLGMKESHLKKAQHWFNRFGKWSLFFGYFIPGVRHFVGYTAGMLAFPYKDFSAFAYTGGMLWASSFLTLGYHLHEKGGPLVRFLSRHWLTLLI